MNYLPIILFGIAIGITILYNREHMSNADVLAALKEYGVDDEPPQKKGNMAKNPILGPSAENPETDESLIQNNRLTLSKYPKIYGPDKPLVPGVKPVKVSDDDDSETDYNIYLQGMFPGADGPPQPFLTDFSKFHN